jgi:hypothetical protein
VPFKVQALNRPGLTDRIFGMVQGNLDGALTALQSAADLAAPSSTAKPAAAAPVQTFALRPRKSGVRKQSGKTAAFNADATSSIDAAETATSMRSDSASVGSSGSGSIPGSSSADQSQRGGGKETAVRALLAAGSMLARAGRKAEAVEVVRRAVALDSRLRTKFLDPLEQELRQLK